MKYTRRNVIGEKCCTVGKLQCEELQGERSLKAELAMGIRKLIIYANKICIIVFVLEKTPKSIANIILGVPATAQILTGDSQKLSFSILTKVPFLIF